MFLFHEKDTSLALWSILGCQVKIDKNEETQCRPVTDKHDGAGTCSAVSTTLEVVILWLGLEESLAIHFGFYIQPNFISSSNRIAQWV